MKCIFHFNFFLFFSIIKYIFCNEGKNHSCFEYSCEECESEDYGKCTKCREGFRLVQGTCPCYDFHCALCTNGLYDIKNCFLCKKGYYNNNNICTCDIDGCAVCENNKCLLCYDGYILNTEKTCDVHNDENRIRCFDSNCEICLSEEEGGCEECKKGYKLEKGKCNPLPVPDENNKCETGFFEEEGVCQQICGGLTCTKSYFNSFLCSENECLYCYKNNLGKRTSCDSSKVCTKEGCLMCISEDECLICSQGYYLLSGICRKCINGCSICANNETCQYCLSGYDLDDNSKCIANLENPDFNINLYQKRKFQLIKNNFPKEYNEELAHLYDDIQECDEHCIKCDENSATCKQCDQLYKLENNKCNMSCTDENCLSCTINIISEECTQCKEGYIASGKNCFLKCSDKNCRYCSKIDDQEICIACLGEYKLDGIKCKLRTNYLAIIYTIAVFLILALLVICFCWYKQKNIQERQEIIRNRIAQGNIGNVAIYNRNSEESSRKKLTQEEIVEEFEKQKLKTEKGFEACQFCKKKPGKYRCDCNCVVCKEHSLLRKEEGDGENYKVCYNCGKVVKKVTPIKKQCNICFEKKITLVHFKCECALLVCKDCYVKCRLESDKCPGCRAKI